MKLGFALACLIGTATLAAAQDATRIARPEPARPREGVSAADQARQVSAAFGSCVVRRNPEEAARAVTLGPDAQGAALRKVAVSDCLGSGVLSSKPDFLRGSIFAAMYRRDHGRIAPALAAAPLDYAAGLTPDEARMRNLIALRQFASCVARRDLPNARAAVLAAPASAAEDRALAALNPALSACLDAGATITFGKAMLQATLAEVLYREAASARAEAG